MKRKLTQTTKNLTNSNEHYYLSEQGLESLKQSLVTLRAKRLEQVAALSAIRDQQSDEVTIEDASFIYTKGAIDFIDSEIARIEDIVTRAQVVHNEQAAAEKVMLGSRVQLKGDGQSFEYTIVHSFEADPSVGKISPESPLGRLLLGKRLLDKITFGQSRRHKATSLKLVGIQ